MTRTTTSLNTPVDGLSPDDKAASPAQSRTSSYRVPCHEQGEAAIFPFNPLLTHLFPPFLCLSTERCSSMDPVQSETHFQTVYYFQ